MVSAILSKLNTGGSGSTLTKTSASDALGVDASAWTISFQELSLVKQIGEGSFGRVYLADWNATKVAVKLLLGPAASLIDADAAADMALSLHNPVLAALKTVGNHRFVTPVASRLKVKPTLLHYIPSRDHIDTHTFAHGPKFTPT